MLRSVALKGPYFLLPKKKRQTYEGRYNGANDRRPDGFAKPLRIIARQFKSTPCRGTCDCNWQERP
jgi:hypothetical protein